MLVNESLYAFLNESFIAEEILNERFNINSIKGALRKASILATMFLITASNRGLKELPSKQEVQNHPLIVQLAKKENVFSPEIEERFNKLFFFYRNPIEQEPQINYDILQDPLSLNISKEGIEFIKEHEGLKLEAYDLGDGKITIGWGHTGSVGTAGFFIGQKISETHAEKLLMQDIKRVEDGLRRLFQMWQDQGIEIKVSQHMWDSMVSMGFNMGVNGFRSSDIVSSLKQENYLQAADSILTTRIKKYPGLQVRRQNERDLFLKDLLGGVS